MIDSLAACDKHLPNLLRQAVPENDGRGARIVNLTKPDELYKCECGVPAHWYVRLMTQPVHPGQEARSGA